MLKINTKKVKITELKPNEWNPKLKLEEDLDVQQQYEEVVKSIKNHGLVEPILVRSARDKKELGYYEIINGYHRFLACQELKFDEVIVNDLGEVSDQEAKKLTIVTEEIKIPIDQVKLSQLLKEAHLLVYRYQKRDNNPWTQMHNAAQAVREGKSMKEAMQIYMYYVPENYDKTRILREIEAIR